jgi:hypothetical protein
LYNKKHIKLLLFPAAPAFGFGKALSILIAWMEFEIGRASFVNNRTASSCEMEIHFAF